MENCINAYNLQHENQKHSRNWTIKPLFLLLTLTTLHQPEVRAKKIMLFIE